MIIIDGDACPSIKLIEETAKVYQIKVLICHDTNHIITSDYSQTQTISEGPNSVDIYIANITKEKDIVITNDYPLALTALSKNSYAISPKGLIYTKQNIDTLMLTRYINNKQKPSKIKGPKKRKKEDDINLINNLKKLIEKSIIKWYN